MAMNEIYEEIQAKAKVCCKSLTRFFYLYCQTPEIMDDITRRRRATERSRRVRLGTNHLTAPEIEKLNQLYDNYIVMLKSKNHLK